MTPADLTPILTNLGWLMLAAFWSGVIGPRVGRAVARRLMRD